jgi:hypothetical protein
MSNVSPLVSGSAVTVVVDVALIATPPTSAAELKTGITMSGTKAGPPCVTAVAAVSSVTHEIFVIKKGTLVSTVTVEVHAINLS